MWQRRTPDFLWPVVGKKRKKISFLFLPFFGYFFVSWSFPRALSVLELNLKKNYQVFFSHMDRFTVKYFGFFFVTMRFSVFIGKFIGTQWWPAGGKESQLHYWFVTVALIMRPLRFFGFVFMWRPFFVDVIIGRTPSFGPVLLFFLQSFIARIRLQRQSFYDHYYRSRSCLYLFTILCYLGFYWVLLGFTGLYSIFTGFHWVLMGFTGFYWVLLSFTGFYYVILGFTGF